MLTKRRWLVCAPLLPLLFLLISPAIQGPGSRPAWAGPITIQLKYEDFGHIANDGPRCVATAMMNSFVFLKNKFPGALKDTKITTGTKDTNTLEQARTELSDGWGPGRPGSGSCGATEQSWWEAKVLWLDDFAPGKIFVSGMEGDEDPSGWGVKPRPLFAFPTLDFLVRELTRGEDVELGLRLNGERFHAVTLTSVTFDDRNGNQIFDAGEPPLRIDYLDPNDPSKLLDGALSLVDGKLQFPYDLGGTNVTVTINVAYSESVPAPITIVFVALGMGAVLTLRATKARRQRR